MGNYWIPEKEQIGKHEYYVYFEGSVYFDPCASGLVTVEVKSKEAASRKPLSW